MRCFKSRSVLSAEYRNFSRGAVHLSETEATTELVDFTFICHSGPTDLVELFTCSIDGKCNGHEESTHIAARGDMMISLYSFENSLPSDS